MAIILSYLYRFSHFFAICVPGHHTAKRQKSAQDNYLLAYNFVLILIFFSLAYSAVNTFSQIYYKIFCWKESENRLRFDRIMATSLWSRFWPTLYILEVILMQRI